jgi:2-polyprenyl-3-methyl-5-hydroxy-6-metoxy-1,4-benzoquinol methylase
MAKLGLKALYDRERAIRPPDVLAEGARIRQAELNALFFSKGEIREELVTRRTICPMCGESALKERARAKGWPMAGCEACGGVTTLALPTATAWDTYYSTSRAEAMFQRRVYEGTKEQRFTTVDEPRARWIVDRCRAGGPKALLDVGCASGAFLEAMRPASDWECHGIDANPAAVKLAREKGLRVTAAQFDEYEPARKFDAITFFSVLAQVDDPLRALRCLRRSLVDGGRVFLCDVNFDGFYAAVVGEDHLSYVPPIHRNYFTATTIVTMLEAAGYRNVEVTTPGQLDVVRVWMYWEAGGMAGRNAALHRMIAHELENDSALLQDLVTASRASEHMWVTARTDG